MALVNWEDVAKVAIAIFDKLYEYVAYCVYYCFSFMGVAEYGNSYGALLSVIIATTFIMPIFVLGIQKIVKNIIFGGLNGFVLYGR